MSWAKPLLEKNKIKIKGKRWSNAQPTKIDGYNFASKLEAAVYCQLKLLERAGEISDIRCQHKLHLTGNLNFNVDFVVFNNKRNCEEAHEAKGREFERFKTIVQAWPGVGPMDLIIWGGQWSRPRVYKTVRGK
jgi:hypothetical protein